MKSQAMSEKKLLNTYSVGKGALGAYFFEKIQKKVRKFFRQRRPADIKFNRKHKKVKKRDLKKILLCSRILVYFKGKAENVKMKRAVRVICMVFVLAFFVTVAQPFVFAAEEKSVLDELLSVADGIIKWKKQSMGISDGESLLCEKFTVLAGTSSGDWYPIGLSGLGRDENYIGYLASLKDNIERRYAEDGGLDRVKATEWHRTSLAVLASGGDPTTLCKDENGNTINLIADGVYNRGAVASLGAQGISGWIWGLIALDGRFYEVPDGAYYSREDIIKEILCRQLKDGGFAMSGSVSDPDITAMAIQALAPYYNDEKEYTYTLSETGNVKTATVRAVTDEALERLSALQLDTGDYRSWGLRNPGSVCQVIVALCSLGINPLQDARFIKNGKTLWDGLMIYHMSDGGFASAVNEEENPSSESGKSNSMAGEQALYAIAAIIRLRNGERALYDFCDEMSGEMKNRIATLVSGISEVGGDTDASSVKKLLSDFYSLPASDRRYVTNYPSLSDAAKSKGIDISAIAESTDIIEDTKSEREPLVFSEADKKAADAIPTETSSSEYYQEVTELLYRLEICADFDGKSAYTKRLSEIKCRMNATKAEIKEINRIIKEELGSGGKASLSDRRTVEGIISRCEALPEYDRGLIENYEDVMLARARITTSVRAIWISAVAAVLICVLSVLVIVRIKRRKTAKQRGLDELSRFYEGEDE